MIRSVFWVLLGAFLSSTGFFAFQAYQDMAKIEEDFLLVLFIGGCIAFALAYVFICKVFPLEKKP